MSKTKQFCVGCESNIPAGKAGVVSVSETATVVGSFDWLCIKCVSQAIKDMDSVKNTKRHLFPDEEDLPITVVVHKDKSYTASLNGEYFGGMYFSDFQDNIEDRLNEALAAIELKKLGSRKKS